MSDNVVNLEDFKKKSEPKAMPTIEDIRNTSTREEAMALFPKDENGNALVSDQLVLDTLKLIAYQLMPIWLMYPEHHDKLNELGGKANRIYAIIDSQTNTPEVNQEMADLLGQIKDDFIEVMENVASKTQ